MAHRFPVDDGIDPAELAACGTDAPIRAPEAIQPHGALLAIDAADRVVVRASANLPAVLGIAPDSVLGLPLAAVLSPRDVALLLGPDDSTQLRAGMLRMALPGGSRWLAATACQAPCGRICIELEPQPDQRTGDGRAGAVSAEQAARVVLAALRRAESASALCDVAAREMRRLTGHDRAMVYRFAADGHGAVVAEDRAAHLPPYLGLRYPAADVPEAARALFGLQRVRTIPDIVHKPVPLLSHPPRAGRRLDMTYCALRSVAPVHLEYMVNMGVRGTLVIGLTGADGRLWGLLVCHDSAPRAVPPELRGICDLIGQVVSVLLAAQLGAEALQAQLARERHLRAIAAAMTDPEVPLLDVLAAQGADMLALADATGARAQIGGAVVRIGVAPEEADAVPALAALLGDSTGAVMATERFAALAGRAEDVADVAAGAMAIRLPHGAGGSLAWFRPELPRTVVWAGDPGRVVETDAATGRLSPRRSFAAWREQVRGTSAAWRDADLAAAAELRRIVAEGFVRRAERELARLRNIDPLTGLRNRRVLQERLDLIGQRDRSESALIYIDLDRFKDVNDSLGHDAGDTLLVGVADRLRARIGERDLVARIGGDEFAVLCDQTSLARAEELAGRVRAALEQPFELAGRPYRATASVGVAHTSTAGGSGAALLQAADAAMYVAKRAGGNGAACYAESLRDDVRRRFTLEQALRAALQSGGDGLSLAYQPLVAAADGGLLGFEALARWQHKDWGAVPPMEFVAIAEAGGFVTDLGDWVLRQALDQFAAWRAAYPKAAARLTMAVNVSPRQLGSFAFSRLVAESLAARGIAPDRLVLEVTEAALADTAGAGELTEMRRLGVQVAIDDFGTGYSSLSYLRRLPVDTVKLDRSFLPGGKTASDRAQDGAADEAFMAAVISVAASAKLLVVVEGVETQAHYEVAVRAGAAALQGFLFARPMAEADAGGLLARLELGGALPWAVMEAARIKMRPNVPVQGLKRRQHAVGG